MRLAFLLNGEQFETEATGSVLLLDLIRGCGLWGTREGCGVGVCGACTVLVDGDPVRSCMTPIAAVEKRSSNPLRTALHPGQ